MNRITVTLASLTLLMTVMALPAQATLVILDKIIAIVDEDVIMLSELDARRDAIKSQLAGKGQPLPPDDILSEQIIERLIIESLQLQMAERAGVRISDEELNDALSRIAAQNKMDMPTFIQNIEKDGISYADMREQVRREISITRVQQSIMRRRIKISEQDIKNFLSSDLGENLTADEYRLAHILLPLPDKANANQILKIKNEAIDLVNQLEQGASFQKLAIEKSAGQNALNGGDLGWRKSVQLPTMFLDIAPTMSEDDIKGPIRSGSGYHIIKLLGKRGAKAEGNVPQTQVRHVLIKLSEIRTDQEAREFCTSLRDEIAHGRDFEEIAKLHSDDPGSALSGGDLGWNRAGIFVPEFEYKIQHTAINELSEVFKTVHGYHFLEVTGMRIEDFSERFKIRQAEIYLRNQKHDEELQTWISEIREDAFVEIRF